MPHALPYPCVIVTQASYCKYFIVSLLTWSCQTFPLRETPGMSFECWITGRLFVLATLVETKVLHPQSFLKEWNFVKKGPDTMAVC